MINKKMLYGYIFIGFILSMYIHKISGILVALVPLLLITLSCFLGFYFLIKDFKSDPKLKKKLIIASILAFIYYLFIWLYELVSLFS